MLCSRIRILNSQLPNCPHQNALHTSSSGHSVAFFKKNPVAGRAKNAKRQTQACSRILILNLILASRPHRKAMLNGSSNLRPFAFGVCLPSSAFAFWFLVWAIGCLWPSAFGLRSAFNFRPQASILGAHAVGFRIAAIRIPRWPLASGIWALAIGSLLGPSVAFGRRPSAFCFRPLASSYWAHAVNLGLAVVGVRCFPVWLWCLQFWRWSMSPWSDYRAPLEFGLCALRLRFYVVLQSLGSRRWHLTFGLGLSSFRQWPAAFSVVLASLHFALGVWTCAFGVWCWPLAVDLCPLGILLSAMGFALLSVGSGLCPRAVSHWALALGMLPLAVRP